MTTVIEKAKQIGVISARVLERDRELQQAGVWVQGEAKIRELITQFAEATAFLQWVASKGPDFAPAPPAGLDRAKKSTNEYLTYLSDRPDPDKAHQQISNLSKLLEVVIKSQRDAARLSWESYTASIKWENVDIYAAFKNDDTHGGSFLDLVNSTRDYHLLRSEEFLKQEQQRLEFDGLLQTHDRLIQSLPPMPDEEVRNFLVAAASSAGAPLGNLTENVLSWLKDHRLTAKYSARRRES